jgi:hypothetical protein
LRASSLAFSRAAATAPSSTSPTRAQGGLRASFLLRVFPRHFPEPPLEHRAVLASHGHHPRVVRGEARVHDVRRVPRVFFFAALRPPPPGS